MSYPQLKLLAAPPRHLAHGVDQEQTVKNEQSGLKSSLSDRRYWIPPNYSAIATVRGSSSMGKCNTILSAYTKYKVQSIGT